MTAQHAPEPRDYDDILAEINTILHKHGDTRAPYQTLIKPLLLLTAELRWSCDDLDQHGKAAQDRADETQRDYEALEIAYGDIALAIEDIQRGWCDFSDLTALMA